jgi:hypothetical protein
VDQFRLGRITLDFASQPLNSHVHDAGFAQIAVAPHTIKKHFSGEDLPFMSGKLME